MIRWTASGAVSEPETLQIRVAPAFSGRVEAGAPLPSRSLRPDEIEANLRHFTEGRRGPRSRPARTLVLGGGLPPAELSAVVELARQLAVQRVALHLGPEELREGLPAAEARVVRVTTPAEAQALAGWDADAVVLLHATSLPLLPALTAALEVARPRRVVFTWPLAGVSVPTAQDAAQAVRPCLERLDAAGIPAGVKGIPLCTLAPSPVALPPWEARVWRSANRWYVDADHQGDQALVFFPDVVRFAKVDSCRFCAVGDRCDGVVETWLRGGLAGPLVPLPR